MAWQETKSKILEVYAMVINSLKKRYSFEEVADGVQFQNTKGIPFIVYDHLLYTSCWHCGTWALSGL